MTGASNRAKGISCHSNVHGDMPINFDSTVRSVMSRKIAHSTDLHVPLAATAGTGNSDFAPKLPGHDYRAPYADLAESKRIRKETRRNLAESMTKEAEKMPATVFVADDKFRPSVFVENSFETKAPRPNANNVGQRWNPANWHDDPAELRPPLQKEEGETWNSRESQQIRGYKGQDKLMRAIPQPEEAEEEADEMNADEYYIGRGTIDRDSEDPNNDYQVRPANLPDFYDPPPEDGGLAPSRMQRLREVIRQRYAGRPRLLNVFRNFTMTQSGHIFPKDLQRLFDQMGLNVKETECGLLVKAVDKDKKGAITFDEFADLIYGAKVRVGGHSYEPQDRFVRHMTNTVVDRLVANGQMLGKAFCGLDPEKRYMVSKAQFANALGTACQHLSNQAVDFLWAAQFGTDGDHDDKSIDWRSFMSQLAHWSQKNRAPTPCPLQGRKHQYDLLQRSAAISGGYLADVDLNRPEQDPHQLVVIKADKLVYKQTDLANMPREAGLLTESYLFDIRTKAHRVEQGVPVQIKKSRMRELLQKRKVIHQDELVDLLCNELENPNSQVPLVAQEPLYIASFSARGPPTGGRAEIMTLDGSIPTDARTLLPAETIKPQSEPSQTQTPVGIAGRYPMAPSFLLQRADVKAYVSTQRVNKDFEVDVDMLIENLYKPPEYKKVIETVNDGLNRHIRGNRPGRERPSNERVPRYENYWQARFMMEALADQIASREVENGGKLKPSKVFKRLDMDNDGYISISDLKAAAQKFQVPHNSTDLHALFSQLDKADHGSIDIGEFTRNFELQQGTILDSMSKPIKPVVKLEGGTKYGGPLAEELEKKELELDAAHKANTAAHLNYIRGGSRASSAPPERACPGTNRSSPNCGRGLPVITDTMAEGRISDVIRGRCNQWKPSKNELYTAPAKTRFGMTIHPDTRHVVEPNVPLAAAFMSDMDRFKTTAKTQCITAKPDRHHPQVSDAVRKHARNEYKVERIRRRQRDFEDRRMVADQAQQAFEERKTAQKALTQLNYERRCKMSLA